MRFGRTIFTRAKRPTTKNLAVELLKRKLLKEEIKKRTKINLVESKKFSEMLEDAIQRYHNGMIDTVEFMEKVLIPFAEQMKKPTNEAKIWDWITVNTLFTQLWK